MRYIESQVYRGAVENVASEMAARMIAMGAATDNAGKLINELQLIYNKATSQPRSRKNFPEIVGGCGCEFEERKNGQLPLKDRLPRSSAPSSTSSFRVSPSPAFTKRSSSRTWT